MAANVLIPGNILRYLREYGYRDDLLREGYVYASKGYDHQISAVGFANRHHESSSACIGVVDGNKYSEDRIAEAVQSHLELGAPVILVCLHSHLQFWHFRDKQAVQKERIGIQHLDNFFKKYRDEFRPDRVFRAKKMGRVDKEYQLEFVDLGLMPFIEKQEGEYLAKLIERIIKALARGINKNLNGGNYQSWHFQTAFWLVGAKILQDKRVLGFKQLDIEDVDSVIDKVRRHYGGTNQLRIPKGKKTLVQQVARDMVKSVSSFSHMTIESLAHVYENALVTKTTRKELGTHATPSWLVNYMVWELADWIEEIPQDKRFILEPACGHAPFLTAGVRLLREFYEVDDGREDERHNYLKQHLIGIEKDSFAIEIARLSLTLADLPNKDGWQINHGDIFSGNLLKEKAKKATILLCNPPFEDFRGEKQNYPAIETWNKSAEVLEQTLPYMPDNSIFGLILPHGFLDNKGLSKLRKDLLDNCEIRTICNLPENVFAEARHLSTVWLGRKKKSKRRIKYIRVSKANLKDFIDHYQAEEELLDKTVLRQNRDCSFWVPKLIEVWEYCKIHGRLGDIAEVGQGLTYKTRNLPRGSITYKQERFKGGVRGYYTYDERTKITELPNTVYMNLSSEVIYRPRWGTTKGIQQILLNYNRASSGPWRLKAWLDKEGRPVSSNFLVIRPIENCIWTLNFFWALVNSPFANAFAYCNSLERHNTAGTMRSMPVPQMTSHDIASLDKLVSNFFEASKSHGKFFEESQDANEQRRLLLEIDAEILRLYDLPPRLEKQLLDFFVGHQRKGVDFEFDRYYPEGFNAYIPLHRYLSEEFQNATVKNVKRWVEENRSPEIVKALELAVEAYEGE